MSRDLQIFQLEQKIERLQTQLDYLRKVNELEAKQAQEMKHKTKKSER